MAEVDKKRVLSIDALRGFDMFFIIGGGGLLVQVCSALHPDAGKFVKIQLEHVPWEGFRFIDLVMPLFIFLAGCSLPFSLDSRKQRGESTARIYRHTLLRVLTLWVFGMLLQGRLLEYDWSRLVFYSNTLQSIAAGTLFSTVFLLHFSKKWQVGLTAGCVMLFSLLLRFAPVPGVGAGVLTPEGNFAHYVDVRVLRTLDAPAYTWVLSTLGFVATAMLGVFAGDVIRLDLPKKRIAVTLLAVGAGLTLAGWAGGFRIPVIKHIWNETFVLYSGGLCFLCLAVFYFLIDVLGWRRWSLFFVVIGTNAIFIYMVTHLFNLGIFSDRLVQGLKHHSEDVYPLISAAAKFAVGYALLLWLYRRRIFFKI